MCNTVRSDSQSIHHTHTHAHAHCEETHQPPVLGRGKLIGFWTTPWPRRQARMSRAPWLWTWTNHLTAEWNGSHPSDATEGKQTPETDRWATFDDVMPCHVLTPWNWVTWHGGVPGVRAENRWWINSVIRNSLRRREFFFTRDRGQDVWCLSEKKANKEWMNSQSWMSVIQERKNKMGSF